MTDFARLNIIADSSTVRTASTDLGNMEQKSRMLAGGMRLLLPALTAVLSARVLTGLADQAREFGAAIGEVSTLLEDMDQMPRIEEEARNLAQEFGSSPTSQAKAFYQAISAGASDAEEATELLTVANRLAVGGVTDVTTAVDGLTTLLNSYNIEAEGAESVSDALFVAMRAGKTTVGELSDSVGRVSALASTAGVSLEEMLASTSALTTGGIATAEAVTGLRAIIQGIIKPSQEAAEAAEELGLKFDLQSLKAEGLQGFLDQLKEKTEGNESAMVELFPRVEALNAILSLTGSTSETFNDILDDMADRTGETEKAFGKMSNEMDFKLSQISAKFETAKIKAGEFLLQLAEPMIDDINANFDSWMQGLADIREGTGDTAQVISMAWDPYEDDIRNMLISLDRLWGDYFGNIEIGHVNLLELLQVGTSDFLGNLRLTIQQDTVIVASFFDKLTTRLKMARATEEEVQQALMALDGAREGSLQDLHDQYMENRNAIFDMIKANQEERVSLEETSQASEETSTQLWELSDANYAAWEAAMVAKGVFEEQTDVTIDLVTELGLLNVSMEDTEFRMQGVKDFTGKTTAELETHRNMVENVQREWANLIVTFVEGESDIGDFFDSIAKGYLRMVAEIASENLVNTIFNGAPLNLFGGLPGSGGVPGGGGFNPMNMVFSGVGSVLGDAGSLMSSIFGMGGNSMVAPGTATSGLFSGMGSMFSGAGNAIGGLLTNPWTWGLGALALGFSNDWWSDPDGFQNSMAGMLVGDTPGANPAGLFDVNPFESGFRPQGFADRRSQGEAEEVIDKFRDIDSQIVDLILGAGGNIDLSNATLAGVGVEGRFGTQGTFLGEGGRTQNFQAQLDSFAAQLVDHASGLDEGLMSQLQNASTFSEIVDILSSQQSSEPSTRSSSGRTTEDSGRLAESIRANGKILSSSLEATRELLSVARTQVNQESQLLTQLISLSTELNEKVQESMSAQEIPSGT